MDLYSVKAILVMDNDGDRLCARYYDNATFPSTEQQTAFEKRVFEKTHNNDAEIILFENLTIVYRSNVDLMFFVIGSCNENELMLSSVLECFYECVSDVLRKQVERSEFLSEYSSILMLLDNMIDGGVILEIDADEVLDTLPGRVSSSDPLSSIAKGNIKGISDMTAGQLFTSAKNMLKSSSAGSKL